MSFDCSISSISITMGEAMNSVKANHGTPTIFYDYLELNDKLKNISSLGFE
jgi:hypothetical protein